MNTDERADARADTWDHDLVKLGLLSHGRCLIVGLGDLKTQNLGASETGDDIVRRLGSEKIILEYLPVGAINRGQPADSQHDHRCQRRQQHRQRSEESRAHSNVD